MWDSYRSGSSRGQTISPVMLGQNTGVTRQKLRGRGTTAVRDGSGPQRRAQVGTYPGCSVGLILFEGEEGSREAWCGDLPSLQGGGPPPTGRWGLSVKTVPS